MYFLRSARYSSAGPESGRESGVPLSDCGVGGRGSLLKLLLGGFCVLANECGMSLRSSSGSVFIWTEGKGRYTTFLFCDFEAEKSSRPIPLGSCIMSKQDSPCWCPRGSRGTDALGPAARCRAGVETPNGFCACGGGSRSGVQGWEARAWGCGIQGGEGFAT